MPSPMSEPTASPVRAPLPTPEQLAAWRVLVERLGHGDDTVVVPWQEVLRELGLL
jgi:hypothetical protein